MIGKPDILGVLGNEGIQLKPKGRYSWALCPLHSEDTPSFKVNPEEQSFYCFGCGTHGDVINFIQQYKNLSFKAALKYLGISGRPYKPDLKETRKRELIREFNRWCYKKYDSLCTLYRELQEVKNLVRTEKDMENLEMFYHLEPLWMHQIEILQSSDDKAKFTLYMEIEHGKR